MWLEEGRGHRRGATGGCDHKHPAVPLDPAESRRRGRRALKLALMVTGTFMVVEFVGGLWTNSLALMADAGHMATDVGALGLSLFAAWIVRRPATAEKTYGYFRAEILAALVNASTLLLIAGLILYHAYERLVTPVQVRSLEMLVIASMGLCANLVTAWILHGSQKHSLNVRGAFIHVLGDLMGSVGAITAGVIMLVWQAYWADPVASIVVCLFIVFNAWRLMRDSVAVLLEGTPAHVNVAAMKEALSRVPGVESVHDLHVWTLTSGVHAMTCHAVVAGSNNRHEILENLRAISRHRFQIHHTTIQLEEENLCRHEEQFCH